MEHSYRTRDYYTYILASIAKVLYVGMTNHIQQRMFVHRRKKIGFTARYNVTRLVYVEVFDDIGLAIAREKEIKKWWGEKKERLIDEYNPNWDDLGADWFDAK